jgi:multidrug efflux pump subunit AcrA (membrane-fusion protein)
MNIQNGMLVALLLSGTIPGCTQRHGSDDEGEGAAAHAVVAVRTAPVVRGDMDMVVTATGSTEAVRREKIYAPIAGTLLSLKALEGTPVRRGDVLAIIQPKETRAAIAGAEALLHAAKTEGERAEARRAIQLARTGENNLEVRSTSDGVVATRSATEGELVAENTELMTVVDLRTLMFVADIPLGDIAQVRPGERAGVSFQALPAERFSGRVDAVNPRTDPASQTVRVRIGFSGEDARRMALLRSDMSGLARIVTGKHTGILIVPKAALLRNDETDAYTVVVATADSLARVVPVVVGARNDTAAEVAGSGLAPGARVVVEGNYSLADSTRIVPAE